MTVAELKELLADYRDDMELYFVAEEMVGDGRLLYGIHDSTDYQRKVFITGRLSKLNFSKEIDPRLAIH
jgi:hypothetical protein